MAEELKYMHRSGKEISFMAKSKKTPKSVYEIWKFFDNHPEALEMDDEDVQEMEGMWFRKASLFQARWHGRPDSGMEDVHYPTEAECITRALAALEKQKQYPNLQHVDIQDIQNNVPGLPFRKKITRKALALLEALPKNN